MAKAKYEVPICPTDCGNLASLPDTNFLNCVEAMGLFESEICDIFMTVADENGDAANLPATFDEAGILAWESANVGADPKTWRRLTVIGDMSSEGSDAITVSKRRQKNPSLRNFNINATVDDMSDLNREYMRELQCGLEAVIYFGTIGGNFFGGTTGIRCTISDVDLPLERGEGNFEIATLVFDWEAAAAPPRIANPL